MVPPGPQNAAQSAGATISISGPGASINSLFNANIPGRIYVDGATICCASINGASTKLSDCTTTKAGGASLSAGDSVTTDPITPPTAQMTTGLVAPDGVGGTLRSYPGAPLGSTVIIYGEKVLSYHAPATTTNTAALTLSSTPITIPVTSTGYPDYTLTGPTIELSIGTGTKAAPDPIVQVVCTGEAITSFTGCTSPYGSGLTIAPGAEVGGPGACSASPQTLSQIGEGSASPLTLYKNNEDYTALRAAYTTNGIDFTDLGVISGPDPSADINDPAATSSPLTPETGGPANVAPGSPEPTELRFVGSRGSIIEDRSGYSMFLSGGWCSDGDSDAFNHILVTTSSDGTHWSTPAGPRLPA